MLQTFSIASRYGARATGNPIATSDLEQALSDLNAEASPRLKIDVLATGLDSPRKLKLGPDGALYVTEAGRGGTGTSIPGAIPGELLFYGDTGAITRIEKGVAERVVTGLPSLAFSDGSNAAGVNAIDFDADGNAYATIGFGGTLTQRDDILKVPDFGQLVAIDSFKDGGSWTRLRDFVAFEQENNPDGGDRNSNNFDLLIDDNTVYVADAGANDLLGVRAFASNVSVEAVFPSQTVINPFSRQPSPQQSVPTSIALGPDGSLYVGELTGFPYQQGSARVYRIDPEAPPNAQPEIFAGGFTNIIDLEFDHSGGLYVLEYDADGLLGGSDAGALIYVSPDGKTRTTIADDELINPTGLEIGDNGDIYISNKGNAAGQGEVLRLSLEKNETPCHDLVNDFVDDLVNQLGSIDKLVKQYITAIAPNHIPTDIHSPAISSLIADITQFSC